MARRSAELIDIANWQALVKALKLELGRRENYFFQQQGENLNIETVIFKTNVPTSSIGWTEPKFFAELGHPQNGRLFDEQISSRALSDMMVTDFIKDDPKLLAIVTQGLKRRAEQEYLMMNMVKGAMWEASEVADEFDVGIAVRGTGLLAHMGIESGDPTKAQEFKNKTSKEVDLILCEEMEWSQLGAVVHYDPRVEWSSREAEMQANLGRSPMFHAPAGKADWEKKKQKIPERLTQTGPAHQGAGRVGARSRVHEPIQRIHGGGPRISQGPLRAVHQAGGALRPAESSIGREHGGRPRPVCFHEAGGDEYGVFMPDTDSRVAQAQKALQNKPTFQAQHGGIWYWKPGTNFNIGIKQKIMGAHGPEGDEPLVYIRPGKQVTAAYYTSCRQSSVGLVQHELDEMDGQNPQRRPIPESGADRR